MCTGVVDHQESIPAMPTTRNVHQVVPVRIAGGAIVNCRGGIDANKVNELFQEHLMILMEAMIIMTTMMMMMEVTTQMMMTVMMMMANLIH